MNYKLICSDIDGTLLNKDRQLSERTITAMKNVDSNVPIILISSRMPKAMRHLQAELDILKQPMIAYNGGLILTYEQEKPTTLLSIEIAIETAQSIIHFLGETSVHTSLYNADEWYVPEMDYWAKREQNNTKVDPTVADLHAICKSWKKEEKGPHKIMCMGKEEEIQLLVNWLEKNYSESLHFYRSKPTYLEIASKKISKLSALSTLLDHQYDINLEEVMAFGDNYNDVEMIQGVGLGVAVENAKPEVKAVANELTDTNKEDGVAKVIERYF